MLTTAGTLREVAIALDFVQGFSTEKLQQMGSLGAVLQQLQASQVKIAELEAELSEVPEPVEIVAPKKGSKKLH